MARQDLRELGFSEGDAPAPAPRPQERPQVEKRRVESEGYVAGMRRFDKES